MRGRVRGDIAVGVSTMLGDRTLERCGKVGIPSSPGPMSKWLIDGSGPYGDSERCDVDVVEDPVLAPFGDIIRLSGVVRLEEDEGIRFVLWSVADSEKAARSDIGAAVFSSEKQL
jgi:hypothetical protein